MSATAGSRAPSRRSTLLLERIATFVFCLPALSFGWWLGGGFSHAAPAVLPAPADIFSCAPNCDDSYLDYLDAQRARSLAWRHGGR
jgi:hypothetical protein